MYHQMIPFLYSNERLFSYLEKYRDSEMLLYLYQKNFIGITKFITLILDKIINNFNVLPYSIKTFCKIISLMIEQKFPDITQSEKNIFLAKFFFGRLLIPILRNPGAEAFINSIPDKHNHLLLNADKSLLVLFLYHDGKRDIYSYLI